MNTSDILTLLEFIHWDRSESIEMTTLTSTMESFNGGYCLLDKKCVRKYQKYAAYEYEFFKNTDIQTESKIESIRLWFREKSCSYMFVKIYPMRSEIEISQELLEFFKINISQLYSWGPKSKKIVIVS